MQLEHSRTRGQALHTPDLGAAAEEHVWLFV